MQQRLRVISSTATPPGSRSTSAPDSSPPAKASSGRTRLRPRAQVTHRSVQSSGAILCAGSTFSSTPSMRFCESGPTLEIGAIITARLSPKFLERRLREFSLLLCILSAAWHSLSSSAPRLYAAQDCSSGICPPPCPLQFFQLCKCCFESRLIRALPGWWAFRKPDENGRLRKRR